jgi:hypothetical protein
MDEGVDGSVVPLPPHPESKATWKSMAALTIRIVYSVVGSRFETRRRLPQW